MHNNSTAKLAAIKYEVQQLKSVCSTGVQTATGFDAQQAFAHVCTEMNGVGDWLIKEGRCTKVDWDATVATSTALFAICKIDTKNKHGAADAPKWQTKAHQIDLTPTFLVEFPKGIQGGASTVKPEFKIEIDGTEYDVVDLAEGALKEVETFVAGLPA